MVYAGLSATGTQTNTLIESGISEGLSGRKISASLRKAGYKFSDRDIQSDIRIIRGAREKFKAVTKIRPQTPLPDTIYTNTQLPMQKPTAPGFVRYQTVVRIDGFNTETGQQQTTHVTISHDGLLSQEELKEDADFMLNKEKYNFEVESSQVVVGRRTEERWIA